MMRIFHDLAAPEHTCHFFTTVPENVRLLDEMGIHDVKLLQLNASLPHKLRNQVENFKLRHGVLPKSSVLDDLLDEYDIDLLWFLNHSHLALKTVKYNFVFPVLDLCHRDHPEFPEVR